MATVLLTWELGGGLGHLVNLLPLARGLSQRGHRVVAALRDLSRVGDVFSGIEMSCLQAPIKCRSDGRRIDPPRTFADILLNCGFGEVRELGAMTSAWRTLYDYVQPDLIVFDHSPTAILAARGCPARQALIGVGFCCPLDASPLPDLRPWLGNDATRCLADELLVLKNMNEVLYSCGQTQLDRVTQIYHEVDEHFLLTFPELDHYPGREGTKYWGAWHHVSGTQPAWPQGRGKRVFAYLKPFPAVASLLALLKQREVPTLVVADGLDEQFQQAMTSATLHFQNATTDLDEVGKWCDIAILNGNHGTTASMLLSGKPILQLPIYLEQTLVSEAIVRLGAGVMASPVHFPEIASALRLLLDTDHGTPAAHHFAARYASFDAQQQVEQILYRAEELLGSV